MLSNDFWSGFTINLRIWRLMSVILRVAIRDGWQMSCLKAGVFVDRMYVMCVYMNIYP